MPTAITTSTAATATAFSNQRKIDRCQNGVLWAFPRYEANGLVEPWYSTDDGATWTKDATHAISVGGTTHVANHSVFIDQDDYAHLVYKNGNDGYIYYRRGTPNAGRTAWTWSAALRIDAANVYGTTGDYPDVVAHREGTGWAAHVVFTRTGLSNAKAIYARIAITSAGGISESAAASNIGAVVTGNSVPAYPSIDFNHTGDGKTVAGGTPHLYVGWSAGATGAGHGIRFRKATYSAGSWTWGTEREIDPDRYVQDGTVTWLVCMFDGTRVVLVGALNQLGNSDVVLYERDAADTTTTTRLLLDNVQGTVNNLTNGSASYDSAGNVYLVGVDSVGASGSRKLNYRKWTRAGASLGALVTMDATASATPYVSAKCGYSNNRIEFIYTDGTASPYTVTYDTILLNQPPSAAQWVAPANNAILDRALAQTFDWNHIDPDAGDGQSKFDFRYRPVGAGTWTTITQTTTATLYQFAAGALAAGNYEAQVLTYDSQGVPATAWSDVRYFTMANAPAAPTITEPTSGGTIPSASANATWSTPDQQSYRVRRLADNAGSPDTTTVYSDTGEVASTSTRTLTLSFTVNNRYEHVQVQIKANGLLSTWASVRVLVSYTPPATPTVTKTATAAGDLLVVTSHPTPSGGQPTVERTDIRRRLLGDTGPGDRIKVGATPAGWTDKTVAHRSSYQYQAVAVGSNGTSTSSAWA